MDTIKCKCGNSEFSISQLNLNGKRLPIIACKSCGLVICNDVSSLFDEMRALSSKIDEIRSFLIQNTGDSTSDDVQGNMFNTIREITNKK